MKDASLRQYVSTLFHVLSWKALAAPGLMVAAGLIEGLGLLLLVPLLQLVGLDVGQGGTGRIARYISSAFAAVGLRPTLAIVLALYVFIAGARAFLQRWETSVSYSLQYEFTAKLRTGLYTAIAASSWPFFVRRRHSDFAHVLTSEMDRVGTLSYLLFNLASRGILSAVYLLVALRMSPAMTGVVLVCGGGLALLLKRKIKVSYATGEALSQETNSLYSAISEHLSGMKTARSFGAENRHVEIFAGLSESVRRNYQLAVRNSAGMRTWFEIGSALILCLILYVSFAALSIPTATVLLLLFLFFRMMPIFSGLQQEYQIFVHELPAFASVRRMQMECEAAAEGKPQKSTELRFQREIRFERVRFGYGSEDRAPVIRDVDLVLEAGKTAAIVGPSGAGKSTIADLAIGLIAPQGGRVLIDGIPLEPERLNAWREQIGYVAQDTFLFHDTVRANLLWARPHAGEEDIRRALKQAAIEEFVAQLPRGLDTVVGDRGVLVSGGERQRLALARALLRQPSLLVLDEATSSLDSENELRIRAATDELHGRMTILIISHRLSAVRNADMIYVLENGGILESGTWESLTSSPNGRFRAMCEAQGVDIGAESVRR